MDPQPIGDPGDGPLSSLGGLETDLESRAILGIYHRCSTGDRISQKRLLNTARVSLGVGQTRGVLTRTVPLIALPSGDRPLAAVDCSWDRPTQGSVPEEPTIGGDLW